MPKFISDEEMEQLEGKKKRFISDDEMAAMDSADHVYPQGEPTRITPENPRKSFAEAARGFSPARNIPLIGPLGERLGEGFRAGVESAFGDESYGDAYSRIRRENEAAKSRYSRDYPEMDTGSKVLGALGAGVFGAGGSSIPARIGSTAAITGADTLAQGGSLEDAGKAGALGGGIQAGVEALVPALKAAKPVLTSKGLEDIAAIRALKSVYGNVARAWKETPEAQRIATGLAALKNKVVGFGTTAGGAAERAGKVGRKNWADVQDTFSKMDEAGVGVSGDRIAEEISRASAKIPDIPKNKGILGKMAEEGEYYTGKTLSPSEAQRLKREYQFKVTDPNTHALGRDGNTMVNQAIAKSVREAVAESGLPNAGKFADQYDLSGQLGALQRFGKINADRMTKNRTISLTDYIMLAGGAGVGGGLSDSVGGAGIGGILMALGNKYARTRGNSALAKTLYEAAQVAKKSPVSSARIIDALASGELAGPAGVMIADEIKGMLPQSEEQQDLGARLPDDDFMRDSSGMSTPIPGVADFKNRMFGEREAEEGQMIGSPSDRQMLRGLADMFIPEQVGELMPGMAALPPWVKRADGSIDMALVKKLKDNPNVHPDLIKPSTVDKDGLLDLNPAEADAIRRRFSDAKKSKETPKTFYEQFTGKKPEDAPEPIRFPEKKKPWDIDAEEQQMLDQVMKENPVKPLFPRDFESARKAHSRFGKSLKEKYGTFENVPDDLKKVFRESKAHVNSLIPPTPELHNPGVTADSIKRNADKMMERQDNPNKKFGKNEHGREIGTKGKTGFHSAGGIYRESSIIPRPEGGVMVIPSSRLDYTGPELRFETEAQARKWLESLRKLTKEELEKRAKDTGIDF